MRLTDIRTEDDLFDAMARGRRRISPREKEFLRAAQDLSEILDVVPRSQEADIRADIERLTVQVDAFRVGVESAVSAVAVEGERSRTRLVPAPFSGLWVPTEAAMLVRGPDDKDWVWFPQPTQGFRDSTPDNPIGSEWSHVGRLDRRRAFNEFTEIRTGDDAVTFASQYGPLWNYVIRGGEDWGGWSLPAGWTAEDYQLGGDHVEKVELADGYVEDVETWTGEAAFTQRLFRTGHSLSDGNTIPGPDLDALDAYPLGVAERGPLDVPTDLAGQRGLLGEIVNRRLLAFGLGLQVAISLDAGEWDIHGSPGGIRPALLRELVATLSGAREIATCSGCVESYLRTRAASPNHDNYCDECKRKRVPQQRSEARRREDAAKAH
ncbi:MAG: hypothetical protein ABGY41_21780 [Candidatus Poribacteria bacterium]